MKQNHYQPVLDFWFADGMDAKWYMRDDALDASIKEQFFELHAQAVDGGLDDWAETAEGRLALIILLDQFPRNMFRGSDQAFASDDLAITFVKRGLQRGDDLWLKSNRPDSWRAFFYMPLMHSEVLEDQRRCVELFATHGPDENLQYARLHYDIVARFNRFPHRNEVMGRTSTADEEQFLKQKGSGF